MNSLSNHWVRVWVHCCCVARCSRGWCCSSARFKCRFSWSYAALRVVCCSFVWGGMWRGSIVNLRRLWWRLPGGWYSRWLVWRCSWRITYTGLGLQVESICLWWRWGRFWCCWGCPLQPPIHPAAIRAYWGFVWSATQRFRTRWDCSGTCWFTAVLGWTLVGPQVRPLGSLAPSGATHQVLGDTTSWYRL